MVVELLTCLPTHLQDVFFDPGLPSVMALTVFEKVTAGIGAAVAIAGLFFTGYQLKQAADQLQASTLYSIKKDGRELAERLMSDPAISSYINSPNLDSVTDPEALRKGRIAVGTIFQYYGSVYDQLDSGFVASKHLGSLRADLCTFVSSPAAKEKAERIVNGPSYGVEFKAEVDKCLKGVKP